MRYVESDLFVSNTHPYSLCCGTSPDLPILRDVSAVIPRPSGPYLVSAQHKSRSHLGGGALHGMIWGSIFECGSVGTVLLAVKLAAILHGWLGGLIR